MDIFVKLFKCLCLCILIEKGSWSPNDKAKQISVNKKHRAILNKRLKEPKFKRKQKKAKAQKPEWLKQWTISKGWMHNRSHLLSLGVSSENLVTQTPTMSKRSQPCQNFLDDDSSVSVENIDDLLSVVSDLDTYGKSQGSENDCKVESCNEDLDRIEVLSIDEEINCTETVRVKKLDFPKSDASEVYSEALYNYRKHFPEIYCRTTSQGDIELPEVYKERLLINKSANTNFIKEFWNEFGFKPKSKRNSSVKNIKFTINKLYSDGELKQEKETEPPPNFYTLGTYKKFEEAYEHCAINDNLQILDFNPSNFHDQDNAAHLKTSKNSKTKLGENIAIYNTLNSKTNLHEDPIYECSEDSISLYNNPIYVSSEAFLNQDEKRFSNKFFDFHTNHAFRRNVFIKDKPESIYYTKYQLCHRRKCDSLKRRLKTEKYIIRHIKIRIMLSLRVNRIKKLYRKDARSGYRRLFRGSKKTESSVRLQNSENIEEGDFRSKLQSAHAEQKRIGNGKNSMKIQNMR